LIKYVFHLLCDSFLARRADQASGVDAVFLSELSRRCVDTPSVEDCLHGFKNVLSARRCGGIGILLATYNHIDYLSQFYWGQVFGRLDIVDIRLSAMSDCLQSRVQITHPVMGGTVGFADGSVRLCDIASLICTPREGVTDRVRRHSFLKFRIERSRQLLSQLFRKVMPPC
jgi:hypothetical protein